jgi:hypothetical protein
MIRKLPVDTYQVGPVSTCAGQHLNQAQPRGAAPVLQQRLLLWLVLIIVCHMQHGAQPVVQMFSPAGASYRSTASASDQLQSC